MITALLGIAGAVVLTVVGALAVYQWVFALGAVWPGRRRSQLSVDAGTARRFIVLIPAHNEEQVLAKALDSLARLRYPPNALQVVVAADRCQDGTAACARALGARCLERSDGPSGKGAVIAWAVGRLSSELASADALVILDADTIVDPEFLAALDDGIRAGQEVQQAYCYISNPWQTPFTRIIGVTSILRNYLFYGGKARLGLPAMLVGSGMCFSARIISRYGWNAFSVGEDWEFSASLLLEGEWIYFNERARVFQLESTGFQQASKQRLRWASGRYGVAGGSARALLERGFRERRPHLVDAAVTLLAPNFSGQAALAGLGLVVAWIASSDPAWRFLWPWAWAVVALLGGYFLLGVALTERPLKALSGILLIPVFVPWRMAIEVLGLLGFGRGRWLRTSRPGL